MPRFLQINVVVNSGSTGRIAEEIGQIAIDNGWDSTIAYGRVERPSQSQLIQIGTDWDIKWHGLQTRLFDRHGLGSVKATKKLVEQIKGIKPDLIHLHNLHGYYLNIEILFNYLANANIPVVWTLHDCWAITGHCAHFELVGCNRWQTECYDCPQKKEYPASFFFDRSRKNYQLKKALFNSLKKLTLVPVSFWLGSIIKESYLSGYPLQVINNGIDLNIFYFSENATTIKEKYKIENQYIVLGVATAWSNDKGLKEFIELSKHTEWKVVLIGVSESLKKELPDSILILSRTEDQHELAAFYTAADVFVNPTYQDSFPTVNLEALACGTPVVTYRTGGSPEAIDNKTGIVVDKGNIQELIKAIETIKVNGKASYSKACRERAEKLYNKDDRYRDYLKLYETILSKEGTQSYTKSNTL